MIAQIPGVPDDISEIVDTTQVTPFDWLWALVAVVGAFVIGRFARTIARRYGRRAGLSANIIDLFGTVIMWCVVAVGVVVALVFLGLAVTPLWLLILLFIATLLIGGRSLLEAFGAGVLLQARAPFEPGDLVEVEGGQGIVAEVNSRVVVLDTVDGTRMFIPNTKVLAGTIVNLTHRKLRMATLQLDVEYGTDLDQAIEIAEASTQNAKGVLRRPAPRAWVSAFEDSSVRIAFRFWHAASLAEEWDATDAAARAVYRAFRDAGISFAFPNTTLWWGSDEDG